MKVIFSYDTEQDQCADKVAVITDVHRRHNAPATFFCVGRLIEQRGSALRRAFDRTPDLWDVHSHSYSHKILQPHRLWGKPAPPDMLIDGIPVRRHRHGR